MRFLLFLITMIIYLSCTPPVFVPPVSEEETVNPNWSNVGKVNASFIATSRNLAVSANTGSPTFQISFIASSSNLDSLSWSFPGVYLMILLVKLQKRFNIILTVNMMLD